MPTERMLKLADLLDRTADDWDVTITLLAEHLTSIDKPAATGYRRITEQLRTAAERIREGSYD